MFVFTKDANLNWCNDASCNNSAQPQHKCTRFPAISQTSPFGLQINADAHEVGRDHAKARRSSDGSTSIGSAGPLSLSAQHTALSVHYRRPPSPPPAGGAAVCALAGTATIVCCMACIAMFAPVWLTLLSCCCAVTSTPQLLARRMLSATPTPAGSICGDGVNGTCAESSQCCSTYGYCGTGCAYCCSFYFSGTKSASPSPWQSLRCCQL